jgi:glycosidase
VDRIPFLGSTLERLDVADAVPTAGTLPPAVARRIVAALNAEAPPTARQPLPGELLALSLLHEAAHLAIEEAARRQPDVGIEAALPSVRQTVGARSTTTLLRTFADAFPGIDAPAAARLEDLLLVHLANVNPAAGPLQPLVDEGVLPRRTLTAALAALEARLAATRITDGSDGGISLLDLLQEPARHSPESLAGQLRFIRDRWGWLLGAALERLSSQIDLAIGILTEEQLGLHRRFGGGGAGSREAPSFVDAEGEVERFSEDRDWMPRLVLIAKSTYVWLDQLSRRHGREIRTLDAIPDEELARLAERGITGLWLIGLWQRSRASERIKRWRGNAEAVASAYSLDDYRIADDLGGDDALGRLREQAWRHGIRLASDMVPNHMGIDSRWVIDHPDRFIQLRDPPYPAYRFEGANLADDPRVEIRIEDHYWDDSDAAVVFERRDTATGERRYVYHGNDGTSFPWNDTAQLDFLQADVRETVIRTILDVARRFPVIRFDAAMVLAKKHVERLWYPEPGAGGAIPSRAEFGSMPKAEFDRLMPTEFWRDVVDRVAAEAPDTLLLAEAFWLLEGYFVRTLGMHRVYNSAFMHMIRDENNAGYRKVIRDTVEFDPAILGRYVNFLTNPDEETAIEQFGTGEKYFGAVTLLATLPGLPMLGHGQLEGFTEKYGMEFQRARLEEQPNEGLGAYFDAQIVPLLRARRRFAGSADFRLYDVTADDGRLIEDVFAYSNGRGDERSLIVYHNRFGSTAGWIRESVPFAEKSGDGSKRVRRETLASALGLAGGDDAWLRIRDRRAGLETLRPVGELRSRGLFVQLDAYGCLVLDEMREVASSAEEPWAALHAELHGGWVSSLDDALSDLRLRPIHERVRTALDGSDGADRSAPTVASRLGETIDGLDRTMFDDLRLGTPLRWLGLDEDTIARTRLSVGLATPTTIREPRRLVETWLADTDLASFLEVHDWDGRTYVNGGRWAELLDLARGADAARGSRRASPVLARLRRAAAAAGYDVAALGELLTEGAPAPITRRRGRVAGESASAASHARDTPRGDRGT